MSIHSWLSRTTAAAAILVATSSGALADAVVQSPTSGSTTVARTVPGQTQAQAMTYTALRNGCAVKYENAPVGLGEDGAIHSDTFVIKCTGAGDTVKVETKAGKYVAKWVSGTDAPQIDDNGFKIEILNIDTQHSLYTIRITSTDAVNYALSHVTFTFTEGNYRQASYD